MPTFLAYIIFASINEFVGYISRLEILRSAANSPDLLSTCP